MHFTVNFNAFDNLFTIGFQTAIKVMKIMYARHAAGNQIAVGNIRERLALYYDLEARLEIEAAAHTYEVRIVLPCRQKAL